MADNLQAVLEAVGPRLRALRKYRGITLEQLVGKTGISVSTLSRLESGQRKPTLELLLPIARAHHLPLDELVGAPASGDPRVYPRPIQRNGIMWLPLTRNPGGPAVFQQIIPPQRRPGAAAPARLDQRTHEGHEWIYVIAGRVRLTLSDEDFFLAAGQAAEFDTRIPHAVTNAGRHPAELLNIFGPQGERVHLHSPGSSRASAEARAHRQHAMGLATSAKPEPIIGEAGGSPNAVL